MPTYEYKCKNCELVFEEMHKIAERNIPIEKPCPQCGGEIQMNFCAVGFVDPMRIGVTKRPEWFKDRLREIKKKHPLGKLEI